MLLILQNSTFSLSLWCQVLRIVFLMVKHLPTMQETWVRSLSWEDSLEKEMATHFSTLAWKIPWTEECGRLQSMGSQRVRQDWTTFTSLQKDYTYALKNKYLEKLCRYKHLDIPMTPQRSDLALLLVCQNAVTSREKRKQKQSSCNQNAWLLPLQAASSLLLTDPLKGRRKRILKR